MKAMKRLTTKIADVALATVMMAGGMTVLAAENGEEVFSDNLYTTAKRDCILFDFDYFGASTTMTAPVDGIYTFSFSCEGGEKFDKTVTLASSNGDFPAACRGRWNHASINDIELHAGVEYRIDAYTDGFMSRLSFANDGISIVHVSVTLAQKVEEPKPLEDPSILWLPNVPQLNRDPQIQQNPEIPAMPQIVIDTEPETPVTFTTIISTTPVNTVIDNPTDEITTTDNTTIENTTSESTPVENTSVVTPSVMNPVISNTAIAASETPVFSLTAEQMRVLAVRNFVGHLYTDGLGRRATESEITEWADKLMCGSICATEAATQILTSSELNEHDFDNEQIAVILSDVFNTTNDSDILAELNNGTSVVSVIEQLSGTDNWASKCALYGVNV